MSDFYTGSEIKKDYDTNRGLANGWVPIRSKKVPVKPTPDCAQKYWDIQDGDIVEVSQEQKDAIDNPPLTFITAKEFFKKVFDEYGKDFIKSTLKKEFTSFLDMLLNQEAPDAWAMAKEEIDAANLSDEVKAKLKSFLP